MSKLQGKTDELKSLMQEGEKYTMFSVSDGMAITVRLEFTLKRLDHKESWAQYKNITGMIFIQRGKRKEVGTYLTESIIILKGWDLGISIDSDGRTFSGNALLNFVGNPDEIRAKIESNFVFGNRSICVYGEPGDYETQKPLYIDDAIKNASCHAVMERILRQNNLLNQVTV